MPKRITLTNDLADIVNRLSAYTGQSASCIVNQLLGAHLHELHEVDVFLETHPAGAGSLHEQAVNLLRSYGPESILDGLARIAPRYETLAARFLASFDEPPRVVRSS